MNESRDFGRRLRQRRGRLLHQLGYSLQVVRKTREGKPSPDRNEQFEHINRTAKAFMKRGQPVVSVDTKKMERVGDFKNGGREWQPKGEPEPVRVHDFIDKELGKVIPYGVYDPSAIRRGSASASITTPRNSRSRASNAGGVRWAKKLIRTRLSCSSPPTVAEATRLGPDCGESSCSGLPMSPA